MTLPARLSFVTLAVTDLVRARAFYVDGLGWPVTDEVAGDVVFVRMSPSLMLSLWNRSHFEAEVGPIATPVGGVSPFTLAYNVATPAEVDTVLAIARTAGAATVRPAEQREWGGYTGYFIDPDGHHWEVAYNPGPMGRSVLPD